MWWLRALSANVTILSLKLEAQGALPVHWLIGILCRDTEHEVTRAYEAQRPAAGTNFHLVNNHISQNFKKADTGNGIRSFLWSDMKEHTLNKLEVGDNLNWLVRASLILFMQNHVGTHLEQSWSRRQSELASQVQSCPFHAVSWRNTPRTKLK